MKAYSIDLRVRVFKDLDGGMKTSAVAVKYSVSPAWVRRLKQRRRRPARSPRAEQRHGPAPRLGCPRRARSARWFARPRTPRSTSTASGSPCRCRVSASGPCPAALGLTRKKSRSGPAEQDRPDVKRQRDAVAGRSAGARPGRSWCSSTRRGRSTNMTRTHGRCPQGERLVDGRPARALEDDDVRGGAADRRAGRPDGGGRGDDRRRVRGLRRAGAGADAAAGRRGGDGQPVQPQAGGGAGGDRGGRVRGAVPAAVQPGPEPDREGVQQVESEVAGGGRSERSRNWSNTWARCWTASHPKSAENYFRELRLPPAQSTREPL